MRYENEQLLFSPSDLVVFLDGDFASWMDRWHLERGRGNESVSNELGLPIGVMLDGIACLPDAQDAELQLTADKGMAHERAFLQELRNAGHEIVEIDADWPIDEQIGRTIEALRNGAAFIYQGRLAHGEFAGLADFLVRQPGESKLGDYHYEVWDTKLARSLKPYFIVQLCAYSQLLEVIQGRLPECFSVVLGNGQRESRSVRKYLYYFKCFRQAFLDFQGKFASDGFPDPGLARSHGRWSTFATSYLEAGDHLSRVANITRTQISKLEAVDIHTLSALATTKLRQVPRLAPPMFRRLQTQARLQLSSRGLSKPLLEIQPLDQLNPRRGLASLPPESPLDVYFDMEGFPLATDGLEYLFGASCCDHGATGFFDWWAHEPPQEKLAFEGFIDWAHARWRADPEMHIYHYASYEVTALRRLMGKYASRERELDELLRHHVFVDLFTVVRQGLAIGTAGYSLKDIECLYSEPRKGDITTAGGSILAYHAWMESRQSQDWRESPLLQVIRDYNQVDCESTGKLAAWLRTLQHKSGVDYIPPPPPPVVSDQASEHPSSQLAERLLREIDEGLVPDPQQATTQRLLAYLLEFHWREAKPVFWAMFSRHEMSEQELVDDLDCLGRLERTAKPPRQVKRSLVYEYQFNPDQDTKLHEGSSCYYAHDLSVTTKIEAFKAERGLVEIKLGPKRDEPPTYLSLIPSEYVSADTIAQAVFRYVEAWHRGEIISPAVDDLLQRRPPRLTGKHDGPIIPAGADLLNSSVTAVL